MFMHGVQMYCQRSATIADACRRSSRQTHYGDAKCSSMVKNPTGHRSSIHRAVGNVASKPPMGVAYGHMDAPRSMGQAASAYLDSSGATCIKLHTIASLCFGCFFR